MTFGLLVVIVTVYRALLEPRKTVTGQKYTEVKWTGLANVPRDVIFFFLLFLRFIYMVKRVHRIHDKQQIRI